MPGSGSSAARAPAAVLALSLAAAAIPVRAADISPDDYIAHVRYLASDELKGRATGSPELEQAASYIATKFETFGLRPASGGSYLQEFTALVGSNIGPANRFSATVDGKLETLRPPSERDADFVPFNFSSSGTAEAVPVVFAGYGITAQEYNYDDYAGIDATGKFVLILRHEPQEADADSVFNGRNETTHSGFANKAINAKLHGARGVILINDTEAHPGVRDALIDFGRADGPTDAEILFVQIKSATAQRWLAASGHDLGAVVAGIDRDLKPNSFPLDNVTVSATVDIERERKQVHNVVGYVPGTTDEYIIIGAHYDHLGLGDARYSLAPNRVGEIHHGADDNASGTAGVIELARWFGSQPPQRRGLLFMTFAGEEIGLLGSSYFTNEPLLPLKNAVAMINMDMIGRITRGKVYINGAETGSTFTDLVNSIEPPDPLQFDLSASQAGYAGSDHYSFLAKQIPSLFFFSGLHGDYHKPSDTWDKINAKGAVALLDYVADLTTRLANDPMRPEFRRAAAREADPHSGGDTTVSGYGPDFGSIPDFNEPETGVRFADIRAGSPADKAGFRGGDILIEFDGQRIGNLYDFTYALQSHMPGDEVLVKVIRGDETIEAKVLLTERR